MIAKANKEPPMRTKNTKERFFHAIGFEMLAIVLVAPLAAWMMDKPLLHMGALTITLSIVAMLWNMVYNHFFDKLCPPDIARRGFVLRTLHAVGFEGGFIIISLPLVAGMLSINFQQAFMTDIIFFLFYLPYTMIYNWLWDHFRQRFMLWRKCKI